MVLRVVLVTGIALSLMSVIANGSALRLAGGAAGCSLVHAAGGSQLESCHPGWFRSYPNLAAKGCRMVALGRGTQYWSCPIRIGA